MKYQDGGGRIECSTTTRDVSNLTAGGYTYTARSHPLGAEADDPRMSVILQRLLDGRGEQTNRLTLEWTDAKGRNVRASAGDGYKSPTMITDLLQVEVSDDRRSVAFAARAHSGSNYVEDLTAWLTVTGVVHCQAPLPSAN